MELELVQDLEPERDLELELELVQDLELEHGWVDSGLAPLEVWGPQLTDCSRECRARKCTVLCGLQW
jgi:hypothetical protein